MLDRCAKSGRR